jgi:predicted GIY-YIG superfamily endonuclease
VPENEDAAIARISTPCSSLSKFLQETATGDGVSIANASGMRVVPMRHVYVLQSVRTPSKHYVGRASDVAQHLATHNSGGSVQTASDRPWQLSAVITFRTEELAVRFEKYLKSGSGRAFADQYF